MNLVNRKRCGERCLSALILLALGWSGARGADRLEALKSDSGASFEESGAAQSPGDAAPIIEARGNPNPATAGYPLPVLRDIMDSRAPAQRKLFAHEPPDLVRRDPPSRATEEGGLKGILKRAVAKTCAEADAAGSWAGAAAARFTASAKSLLGWQPQPAVPPSRLPGPDNW